MISRLGWMCFKCQHAESPMEQRGLTSYGKQPCALCGVVAVGVLINVEKEDEDGNEERPRDRDVHSGGVGVSVLGSDAVDPLPDRQGRYLTHVRCGGVVTLDPTLGWNCDTCRASSLQSWLNKHLELQPPAPLEIEGG